MSADTPRQGTARWLRPLVLVPLALVMIVATLGVLFWFGGPERPVAADPVAAAASDVSPAADPAEEDAGPLPSGVMTGGSGEAPEGGVDMPLIPIPGCKCHSDDPAVVEEHAQYTLADCAECH